MAFLPVARILNRYKVTDCRYLVRPFVIESTLHCDSLMHWRSRSHEYLRVNPRPNRELALHSYDGKAISNWIDLDPSPRAVAEQRHYLQRGGALAGPMIVVAPPTGRYNCHGLTFGSRRTCIPRVGDPTEVDDLLRRDGYIPVNPPMPGDLAIYRRDVGQSGTGTIDHTGVVSYVDPVIGSIRVRSKWGILEEFEHLVLDGPYRNSLVEYWGLR